MVECSMNCINQALPEPYTTLLDQKLQLALNKGAGRRESWIYGFIEQTHISQGGYPVGGIIKI